MKGFWKFLFLIVIILGVFGFWQLDKSAKQTSINEVIRTKHAVDYHDGDLKESACNHSYYEIMKMHNDDVEFLNDNMTFSDVWNANYLDLSKKYFNIVPEDFNDLRFKRM